MYFLMLYNIEQNSFSANCTGLGTNEILDWKFPRNRKNQ